MKRTLLLLTLAGLFALPAIGQRDETLFSKAGRGGLFGSPITEYFNFPEGPGTSTGGGGALLAGDFFFGGYGLVSVDYAARLFENRFRTLDISHAGLWVGYTPLLHKVVHPFLSVKAGWGAVQATPTDGPLAGPAFNDRIFVLTPEAGIELNVFRWFRIAGTLTWRQVQDLDATPLLHEDDLTGLGGTLTLRFGFFGRNKHGASCRD